MAPLLPASKPTSRRVREVGFDAAVAAAFAVIMLLEGRRDPESDVGFLVVGVVILAVLPLLVRRQHPVLAMAGCLVGLVLIENVSEFYETIPFPSMFAGYTIAALLGRRAAFLTAAIVFPIIMINLAVVAPEHFLTIETLKNLGFVALPIALGLATHNRAAFLRSMTERAESAERTREEEAQRRVEQERLRISRDVHDVVAHALVSINVQAGVAAHVQDPDPEVNRQTFREIKQVSGEALSDLRGTLGLLRNEDEGAPTEPTYGLAGLEHLCDRARAVGIDVRLEIDVCRDDYEMAELPTAVDTTAYRVAQEALTNVMRYAGPTTVRLGFRADPGQLTIVVEDDGPQPGHVAARGTGHGLQGMRERVGVLSGELAVGPDDRGGWRVAVSLPLPAPPTPVVSPPDHVSAP